MARGVTGTSADTPLAGCGVLVTRPAHQAEPLCRLIEAAGGTALRFPVLAIAPPVDVSVFATLRERLAQAQIAIFASTNAVDAVRAHLDELPVHLRVAAIGRTTARAVRDHFGRAPLIPDNGDYRSENLLVNPAFSAVKDQTIVILTAVGGRELLAHELTVRGARVEVCAVYRRIAAPADAGLLDAWRARLGAITATSIEIFDAFTAIADPAQRPWLKALPVAVLSERIAAHARAAGFDRTLVAGEASDAGLVDAIAAR